MSISAVEIEIPYAVDVRVTEEALSVDLSDGRTISVPLGWYPRLEYGSSEERANWRLIGNGQGIHGRETLRGEPDFSQKMASEPTGWRNNCVNSAWQLCCVSLSAGYALRENVRRNKAPIKALII